jgi:anti-anti-sigma factor
MATDRKTIQPATLESLAALREFVSDGCRQAGADGEVTYDLMLAVDEVCTNIITHGYDGPAHGSITIDFGFDGDQIAITISDQGRPFDPGSAPPPDLRTNWQKRRPGGLGVYFLKLVADQITYETDAQNVNHLTLTKRIAPDSSRRNDMELHASQRDGITIVTITGSVDALTAGELATLLDDQVDAGHNRLAIDLTEVEYISSAGLRAILATLKRVRQSEGDLRLCGAPKSVTKVLEMSGITGLLKSFATVDEAVASYAG